jgi:CheY-like chemotaxis protein
MTAPAKRVLDVGQCRPDHSAIRGVLVSWFAVDVDQAHSADEAMQKLNESHYDLVLVNASLDADKSPGLEVVRNIRREPKLSDVPVMLVSNQDEVQEAAVEAGAVRGFGKVNLAHPATQVLLKPYLDVTAWA